MLAQCDGLGSRTGEAHALIFDPVQKFESDRHSQFSRCRRGRRAHVRGIVDQRRVGFVADSRDQWDLARGSSANDNFLVKAPEVFDATTTAGDDDDVWSGERSTRGHLVEPFDGVGHLRSAVFALDGDGPNEHFARETIPQTVKDIADDCASWGRHNADHFGQIGQGAFAFCREQSLGSESGLTFFQHRHKCTSTRRANIFDVELVFRLRAKGRQAASGDNFHPFFGHVGQFGNLAFPADRRNYASVVLEVEIHVTRAGNDHAANLAFDTDVAKFTFERAFDRPRNFRDGKFMCVVVRLFEKVHLLALVIFVLQP